MNTNRELIETIVEEMRDEDGEVLMEMANQWQEDTLLPKRRESGSLARRLNEVLAGAAAALGPKINATSVIAAVSNALANVASALSEGTDRAKDSELAKDTLAGRIVEARTRVLNYVRGLQDQVDQAKDRLAMLERLLVDTTKKLDAAIADHRSETDGLRTKIAGLVRDKAALIDQINAARSAIDESNKTKDREELVAKLNGIFEGTGTRMAVGAGDVRTSDAPQDAAPAAPQDAGRKPGIRINGDLSVPDGMDEDDVFAL